MRHLNLFFFPVIASFVSSLSLAAPASKSGVWVSNSTPRVEVKVDSTQNGVAVTMNKDKDQVPTSVGIIFYDANGRKTPMELKTMESKPESGSGPARFSGTMNAAASSFVGFELRIPFRSEHPTIIKSEEFKKVN